MSLTDRQVVLSLGGMLIAATLAAAYCFWQQGRDLEAAHEERGELWAELEVLQAQLDGVVGWLWEFVGLERPEQGDDSPTEALSAVREGDTEVSHPADLFARQQAILARYRHIGQHRG